MTDPNPRFVLLDANVLTRIREIDPSCELVEYISVALEGKCCIDARQAEQSPCPTSSWLICQQNPLSDEQSATEVFQCGIQNIDRWLDEPGDFRIIAGGLAWPGSVVVSGDKRLLVVCDWLNIAHHCVKSAMLAVDRFLSGDLWDSPNYQMHKMCAPSGTNANPFFHFGINTHCPLCDPPGTCQARHFTPP